MVTIEELVTRFEGGAGATPQEGRKAGTATD